VSTSNRYQIYLSKVLQLAETIVIKSVDTADALNQYVKDYYGDAAVDPYDPTSWKYYQNIAGEYHFSDEPMYVTSIDTLDKILFSREQLKIHRSTAREYVYGTRQYKELVAAYPKQEMLILGILYPVDIQKAISAPDGTILGFPPNLIESNEYSLVANLQNWINGFKVRWVNQQYGISDELYPAMSLGLMYLNLVPTILNLRLEACKTNEAHSFHVQQYLASHGMLDVFLDQLTLKQALFFYRNIAYIERNNGQRNIFDWLVEHIMTERRVPIAEYVMRHNVENQPDELYPELAFRKNPLNLGMVSDPLETITLDQIMEKEDKLARDNLLYKEDMIPDITEAMENSLSNVVLTKALESSMIDYSNNTPYTLEDTLVNHWLWLSHAGKYQTFVSITNPKSGERIPLTAKEAFIFMWYAFNSALNIDLVEIPALLAERVQRIPMASVDEIMSVVDHKLVDRALAEKALSMQPMIGKIISTEAFYNTCVEINRACQMQRGLMATIEHMERRGMAHGMISRIYSDNMCRLVPEGTPYSTWFEERNIKVTDFTRANFATLYVQLTKDATGMSLVTTKSLKALQAAMVKMMAQLSSYSVQFITQINNSDIRPVEWPTSRVGDKLISTHQKEYLPDSTVGTINRREKTKSRDLIDVNGAQVKNLDVGRTGHYGYLKTGVRLRAGEGSDHRLNIVRVATVTVTDKDQDLEARWEVVPEDQKPYVPDMYNPYNPRPIDPGRLPLLTLPVTDLDGLWWNGPEGDPELATAMPVTTLNGLNFIPLMDPELDDTIITTVLNGLNFISPDGDPTLASIIKTTTLNGLTPLEGWNQFFVSDLITPSDEL
jgi:hypothetical protein